MTVCVKDVDKKLCQKPKRNSINFFAIIQSHIQVINAIGSILPMAYLEGFLGFQPKSPCKPPRILVEYAFS